VSEPTLELQGLLRALIEQQTALLSAHAESMRVQRVLVERLLGAAPAPAAVAVEAVPEMRASPQVESERNGAIAATVEVVVPDVPPPVSAHIAPAVASTDITPEPQQTVDPAVAAESPLGERPALRIVGGTAVRSDRYYQPAQSKSPQRVSPEMLDVLRRVQAVGDVAHLIVTFGPHAGETLGQVAQSDPDYLRQLAVSAQRPAVRAAAAQVAAAIGEPTAPARRSRAGWRRPSSSARG
jgi:hypothetical protein